MEVRQQAAIQVKNVSKRAWEATGGQLDTLGELPCDRHCCTSACSEGQQVMAEGAAWGNSRSAGSRDQLDPLACFECLQ